MKDYGTPPTSLLGTVCGKQVSIIKRKNKSRFLDVLNGVCWDMQRAYGGGGGGLLFTVLGVLVTGRQSGYLRMLVHRKAP